jgi:DedD protein
VEVQLGAAPAPEEQVLVPEPPAAAPAAGGAREPEAEAAVPPPVEPEPQQPAGRRPEARTVPPPVPSAPPAKAEPHPPRPAASTQSPAWAVQLGAFSNRAKAEQLVAELRKRRYAAFLLEYRASGQVLYRVRVGPEQDRARAEEIAARLAKDGFQPVVARHP